ncbi:trimeric intracellular cation channel family protein [Anaerosacchariphilus polymeriproducens]|uniref:Trimeric intracellular cation channel family protein n=1 Tax=Anaerosacchariphilus polymeriproducens TaxID=1812858 RepID=A0A371AZ20_9FIRM|nr:trimeric intracellular cation channel family protein [Anaerosacchariphilus polymeriproducens]RDU24845.1 trimeric intracellular cation channel family protein [Anaerosacchariphilus polymeriproducens]
MEVSAAIIFSAEILGVIAFAVSGALLAIEKKLDLFGIIFLGITPAVGGGVMRDLLLGAVPPYMFRNPIYVFVAFLTAILVFFIKVYIRKNSDRIRLITYQIINIMDAVGLGTFVVVGADTAIHAGFGKNGFLVVTVGVITGVGGGILRDLFIGHIPHIFRKHVYAIAGFVGAFLYYYMYILDLNPIFAMFIGISIVILLRLMATYFKWNLPRVPIEDERR